VANAVIFTSPTVSTFEKNSLGIALALVCMVMSVISFKTLFLTIIVHQFPKNNTVAKLVEKCGLNSSSEKHPVTSVETTTTLRLRQIGFNYQKLNIGDVQRAEIPDVDARIQNAIKILRQMEGDDLPLRLLRAANQGSQLTVPSTTNQTDHETNY
jgi:hypothetical protein